MRGCLACLATVRAVTPLAVQKPLAAVLLLKHLVVLQKLCLVVLLKL
jgi:hypothetical protein